MSRNASTSNRTMQNKFGSTTTNGLSQVLVDQQLQIYTGHYGGKWVGKKRDFLNMPIYTYESLGRVGHIMVGKLTKLSTDTTTIEFTVAEPPWSTLYKKRCELENEMVPWGYVHEVCRAIRTRETGHIIGSTIGEVLEVDVAETGVQWGKCLRVRVKVDVTKKLVRGKKVTIEGGEGRWVQFKYERLPNFCYHCGLLSHDLKECPEVKNHGGHLELKTLQYGAWLRGEVMRKSIREVAQMDGKGPLDRTTDLDTGRGGNQEMVARVVKDDGAKVSRSEVGGLGNGEGSESTIRLQGSSDKEKMTNVTEEGVQKSEANHERSKASHSEQPPESIFPILGIESQKEKEYRGSVGEEMQWETENSKFQILLLIWAQTKEW
ncbi:hypothetical protein SO802_032169 [Lithocarpus litseifolius]|uniref:Zinc knuckle CX2CX4HX4C domain-containing protein n=1 Tax=Lithocarpus litseifolius TaxID=425828 RepID=A0AAW2BNJ4_9ROSI